MSSYDVIAKTTEFSRDFEVAYFKDKLESILFKTIAFLQEEIDETEKALHEEDFAETVDGFGDVAFVALNGIYKTFRKQGEDHDTAREHTVEVMKRICEANLGKKQADGTVKLVNGKVQKPEGWTPPTYDDLAA